MKAWGVRGLFIRSSLSLVVALAAGCASTGQAPQSEPAFMQTAQQLVLVRVADWDAHAGTLQRYEAQDSDWRAVGGPVRVTIGRKGSAWGTGLHPAQAGGPEKREGDGKAPAGAFRIGTAFGYGPAAQTDLEYAPMDANDWCIDVADSPLYNQLVDTRDVGAAAIEGSTEPMRRDLHLQGDQRYRLGFVIEHNAARAAAGGSCIFAHLWKAPGEPTAGCTAMADADLETLLAWLDRRRSPVFVLLPESELQRLRGAWNLPDK